MVQAIKNEILAKKFPASAIIQDEFIETIYFGGGTPSLLNDDEILSILEPIHKNYQVSPTAEITLEANPDDIAAQKLTEWKLAGINRLSIGVQSFRNQDLLWMNRAHSAQQSSDSLKAAQDIGFSNITIDLIYGLPDFPNQVWQQNVEQALSLGIPHLSCYALTVEPKTALENFIHSGKSKPVDPDLQSAQFLLLMDWMKIAGFEHYEISNFAKPNFRSRHNSSYWQGRPYFGFGPSAHSFDGEKTRWWNVANNGLYLKNSELSMGNGKLPTDDDSLVTIHDSRFSPQEFEILTPNQQINEYLMISLRTMEGIDLAKLKAKSMDNTTFQAILKKATKWESSGKTILVDNKIQLTNEGKLFADGIAADLFV